MPRLDERRRGEPFDEAPSSTVVLRENRRSRSLITVRRLTAQCLPRFGTKEIAQATATLRNFKPVDVADGWLVVTLRAKRRKKFILRSALRPNQISFSHSLGQFLPPRFATVMEELARIPDAEARNRRAAL